jgi:hypothetical protein
MSALPSECSFLVSCPALRDNLLMSSQWSQGEKGTASISEAQASIEVLSPVPGNHLKMHGNASGLHAKPISTSMAECARPSSFRRDDVEGHSKQVCRQPAQVKRQACEHRSRMSLTYVKTLIDELCRVALPFGESILTT